MILQDIISEIDRYKEKLDSFGALDEQTKKRLWEKIRLDWNYHSNSMEGNALSYGETKSLLLYGLTTKGKNLRDFLDMKGHDKALNYLLDIVDKKQLITERVVKKLHQMIIPDPFDEEMEVNPGVYKTEPNEVILNPEFTHSIGEKVEFLEPEKVAEELNKLITKTNNLLNPPKRQKEKYTLHPLLIAAAFHLEFELIHPFNDGNGRLGRILMNLILMQCGYPPVLIKLDERDEYLNSLNKARNEGIEIFTEFLGKCLIRSLKLYMDAAEGKPIEEKGDLDKAIGQLKAKLTDNPEGKLRHTDEDTSFAIDNIVIPFFKVVIGMSKKLDAFFARNIYIIECSILRAKTPLAEIILKEDKFVLAHSNPVTDIFTTMNMPIVKTNKQSLENNMAIVGSKKILKDVFGKDYFSDRKLNTIEKISLSIRYSEFTLPNVEELHISREFSFEFKPNSYTIRSDDDFLYNGSYNVKIVPPVMEELVDKDLVTIVKKIEEHIKSNQKKIS